MKIEISVFGFELQATEEFGIFTLIDKTNSVSLEGENLPELVDSYKELMLNRVR